MAPKKHNVFVILSLAKASDVVYQMIASAAAKAGVSVSRAESLPAEGQPLVEKVLAAIRSASLLLADVSDPTPNVMYELGFAQAQKKPLLLISQSGRSVPFDLAGQMVLIYDLTEQSEFIERLQKLIRAAIRKPRAFVFSETAAAKENRRGVFISYSHADREHLDRLLVHLKPLEREGLIELWVDTRVRAGDRWRKEIEKALQRANVAILLVSADFLASDFVIENELAPLLRSAEERGTRILPVVVKPCRFTRDNNLRHFQAVNDPQKALVLLAHGQQEVLYDQVAAEVERSLRRR